MDSKDIKDLKKSIDNHGIDWGCCYDWVAKEERNSRQSWKANAHSDACVTGHSSFRWRRKSPENPKFFCHESRVVYHLLPWKGRLLSTIFHHHPSSKPTCWSLEREDGPFGFLRSGSLITQARLVSLNGGLIIIAVVWCLMAVGTFLFIWSIVQPGQPTARRAEESCHLTYYIWRVKQNRLSWLRTPPVEAEEGWGCPALVN